MTGGSRGLGRAIALGLATAGADIAVVSRKLDHCQVVTGEIESQTAARAHAFRCHVGRWEEIGELVEELERTFGRIDVLVNNAGMSPLYATVSAVSEELFDKTIAVNLKGPFRLGALIGAHMVDHGGGSIINIGSVASVQPSEHEIPYAAAKAGLDAVTAGLAHAYGPTVRVNSVMCGPFKTDAAAGYDLDSTTARHPIPGGGEPSDVVGIVRHLAGPDARFTTGGVFRVDGGMAITRA
ncbi:MAG: SDR family NAD(P)-dependent oxidoreductase [Desertimonas sp.]